MDFSVLSSSGYRLDCDRDEVASMMVSAPPPPVSISPTPSTPEATNGSRKEKHKTRSKDKKEKKKKKKRSLREPMSAESTPSYVPNLVSEVVDKGKARRNVDGDNAPPTATFATVKVVAPEEAQEAYVAPPILELVFAAPKSTPPDLAEFPMAVEGGSTVAEIKEQLFQRERYLLRSMQFFYEGRELKNPEVFRTIGIRNHSTVHLRNVFSAVNIQPYFGEPYPLACTGPQMTVVDLLTSLFASNRFTFTNLRFFSLSIVRDGVATPVPIDLDKFMDWDDQALPWSTKLSELERKIGRGYKSGTPIRLLPWTSPGDFTTVKVTGITAESTIRDVENKMRKELNAHRRADAPPGRLYVYRQCEPPFGAVPLDGARPAKGDAYLSWRWPPPQPPKFLANTTTLAELGIKAGTTLLIDFWSESSSRWSKEIARKYTSKGIELRVTFPSGRVIVISTGANDLVELLMWKLFCAVGFAPEDQLLVVKGRQLTREQSLSAQGVRDGDTLLVVRRVRTVY